MPYEPLKQAMDIDVDSYQDRIHVSWIDLLPIWEHVTAAISVNIRILTWMILLLRSKKANRWLPWTENMKYFDYYSRAYGAVLQGMLGEYQIRIPDEKTGKDTWKKVYGLKAFSPIADGFYYEDFDDFGTSRSYGYSRRHLGHDLMTSVGSPVTP